MDVEVLYCDVYALIKCLYKLIAAVVATSLTYLVNTTYLPVSTGIVSYFCINVSIPLKTTLSL